MTAAGGGRDRWAQTGRRLATAPRVSVVVTALLTLAVLFELATRTTITSVQQVGTRPVAPGESLQIGHSTGVQDVMLIFLLSLATTISPAFLRSAAAAVTVCAANVLSLGLFHTVTVAGASAQLLVLYRLGRSGSRLLAPSLAVPFPVFALTGSSPTASEAGVLTVLLASLAPAAAWAGLAHRARHEALVNSATQEVIASTLMEHTARGERARIARELHDVVAHHISMIAVQAETARVATPGMPTVGARRLLEIGDTARAALTEMRRLLGVLRDDARSADPAQPSAIQPRAERQPQPSLQQLNELLDEARAAAGTGIRLIVSGSPETLDPGVELAAYRIIQEALTNARRHAPGAAVDVQLHYTAESLQLRIRDNGPGPPSAAAAAAAAAAPIASHGLLGMRERAAAVGGQLRTGPSAAGGFVVEAALPAKAEAVA